MLAVQPDNWRNRSIHADMESCSQKKLLNELDLKKHACREELWPGRGIARFSAAAILNHVFTRLSKTILYTPNISPRFQQRLSLHQIRTPHENDSDRVGGAKETDGKGREKKGAYPPLAIVYAKSTGYI